MPKRLVERPAFTLFTLFCVSALSHLDRQLLNILVSPVRAELDISDVQFSVLQGPAFALVYSLMVLPIAFLADRYSRRKVLIAGILLWSAMTFVFGIGNSFAILILARMGLALGEAGQGPASISILRQTYPADRQSMAVALMTLSFYFGGGLSMIIAGPALAALDTSGVAPFGLTPWRILFVLCASLGAIGFLLLLLMPELKPERGPDGHSSMRAFIRLASDYRLRTGTFLAAFIGLNGLILAIMSWVPEIFIRTYGWSTQQTGLVYGLVYIIGGSSGALLGGSMVGRLVRGGSKQAVVIVIRRFAVVMGVAATLFPIVPSDIAALALAATCMVGLGAMAALSTFGFQALFPAVFSARAVAIFLLITGSLGAVIGPSAVPFLGEMVAGVGSLGIGLSVFAAAVTIWAFMWLSLFLKAPVSDYDSDSTNVRDVPPPSREELK